MFEKELEKVLESDPRIRDLLISRGGNDHQARTVEREYKGGISVSQ